MPAVAMPTRAMVVAALVLVSALSLASSASAQALVEVTTIPGEGWLSRPGDNLGAGAVRLVEGPATPPAGRGSLELSVAATTDRALLTNQFGQPVPTTPRAFDGLTGSWSTFVPAGPDVGSRAAVLKFEAFRDINNPVGTFTTVNVDVPRQEAAQGAAVGDTWQTWTLDADALVWQSDATDSCPQAAPCTLAQFVATFPNARWGTVQSGVGSGAPPGASYVDAVQVSVGSESFAWNFELPADQRSSAVIGTLTPTATGGTVPVTLSASALAVDPVVFTVTVGGVPQDITLQPGATLVVDAALPFGTTTVSVASRGVTIAATDVPVTAPTTPTTASPGGAGTPASPGPTLPATGRNTGQLGALGTGLLLVGASALAGATIVMRRRRAGVPLA